MSPAAAASFVVALDVGTTGVRALLVDADGRVRARHYREVLPSHPGPGLVEHDLGRTYAAVEAVLASAAADAGTAPVSALGITTQRGTAVVWERDGSQPVHPAISWQDARTTRRCRDLLAEGVLVVPLTAASKIEWILDRTDPERRGVESGRLRCGTLDAWLVHRLSGGAVFATDHSHGSCSGFYDLAEPRWQEPVLRALRVPPSSLPALVDSSAVLGRVAAGSGLPPWPIASLIGDQQAAMMGELCVQPGTMKVTYGTAAMLNLHTGLEPVWSAPGAYPLVLWRRAGRRDLCLEGTAITAGAAITWLRDGLGVIDTPADCDALAASVPDSGGVWAVPAFQGLGTPYLDTAARAVIGGLSRASTRAHVVRAVLEGIAWRCREVFDALAAHSPGGAPSRLRADGGAARSDVLLQAQADALGIPVERAPVLEAAALGAAYLAGLATGVWASTDDLAAGWTPARRFEPALGAAERER
ncbi:MAG TPA: FGGY family carbohydrate kinase, partial [Candidatus Limnocylindria bacterium]|nr:FGGY family carbohydrate kinase [Candidatus Limnocylindria bacterium]